VPSPHVPLDGFPAFRAADFGNLAGVLETLLGAKIGRMPTLGTGMDARANRLKLPVGELWFCSYGIPLSVKFPDADCVRVQFQTKSVGATSVRGETIGVTDKQACISEGATEIDFGPDFQQVVWRAPRGILVQKLALIKDGPVTGDLEFDPILDMSTARAATLKHILAAMLNAADGGAGDAHQIVLGELEQAFVVSLLAASQHPHREALDRTGPKIAPWQVRRAEEYIAANWSRTLTIDDLVQVTGVSARTLFRTFKQHRGCSPLEFARRTRLEKARDLIEQPAGRSVTEIAYSCGFGDLSTFSRTFANAFGESPSAMRKRQMQH